MIKIYRSVQWRWHGAPAGLGADRREAMAKLCLKQHLGHGTKQSMLVVAAVGSSRAGWTDGEKNGSAGWQAERGIMAGRSAGIKGGCFYLHTIFKEI